MLTEYKPAKQREILKSIAKLLTNAAVNYSDEDIEVMLDTLELGFFQDLEDLSGDFFGTEGWEAAIGLEN